MTPTIRLDDLCRLLQRAREVEAQVDTYHDADEDPSAVDGDDGEALSVLDDSINGAAEATFAAALDDLGEDELNEVIAFTLVGNGSYEPAEWADALADAAEIDDKAAFVADQSMLAATLEAGMAAFDLSCADVGEMV